MFGAEALSVAPFKGRAGASAGHSFSFLKVARSKTVAVDLEKLKKTPLQSGG